MKSREALRFLQELGDATMRCSDESREKILEIQKMAGVHEDCDNWKETRMALVRKEYDEEDEE